jgi:hypothetical protein
VLPELSRRVQIENQIRNLEVSYARLSGLQSQAYELSGSYSELRQRLDDTPTELTSEDKAKPDAVAASMRRQLSGYNLLSITPSEIDVSGESYRPTHEGFDLGLDLSASYMIRVIWAYLLAFLQVGRTSGNHAGLLMLDEPRQQETARASYQQSIHEAAELARGAQIIFATSEEPETLAGMLRGTQHGSIFPEGGSYCSSTSTPPVESRTRGRTRYRHASTPGEPLHLGGRGRILPA